MAERTQGRSMRGFIGFEQDIPDIDEASISRSRAFSSMLAWGISIARTRR